MAALVVAAALVVLALELSATQSRARQTLTSRFQDRAQVVSALTQAEISSVASSTAALPAYKAARVSARALDQVVAQSRLAYAVLVDRDRRVIAASGNSAGPDLPLSSPPRRWSRS